MDTAAAATTTTTDTTTNNNGVVKPSDGKKTNGSNATTNKKTRNYNNKDMENEVPIEELYDLTKPIPRVEKPNKEEHEAELAVLQSKIDTIKNERQIIQDKIKEAMNPGGEKNSVLNELRTKMNALKNTKNVLIEEKKVLRTKLDLSKASADKLQKDKKDVKSNLKYSSMSEIETAIKKLQIQQETTTMTLNQEKKLLKEIDALQASKKFIAVVQAKDTAMDDVVQQRKVIEIQIKEKDKEIDFVSKDYDAVMKLIKEHNEKDTSAREAIQGLYNERDSYKGKIDEIIKEKDALRNIFREKQNAFYQNQRAIKAQKQMVYEEEKKRREEEYAAKQAEYEAEEAKKIPYEEEQALCEFLADYLERTYMGVENKGINTETVVTVKKDEPVAVQDDPFAGLQAVKNKELAETEIFFGKGKQKKKRIRQPKDTATVPFTLSVDAFEQFGLIMMSPPISIEQVPNSVKELREKKEWYKNQPRGSVPTAADIRKTNAMKTKSSSSSDHTKKTATTNTGSKNFSLQHDDFVPLSAAVTGSTTTSSTSWGKSGTATGSTN